MKIDYFERIKRFNLKLVKKFDGRLHTVFAEKLNSPKSYPIKKFDNYLHKTFNLEYPNSQTEHEYVDLGLPSGTLWATCNVGANSPEEYGDYFAWGETTPKSDYSSSTYTYADNPDELPTNADAAYVNWGSDWRMPSYDQIKELINSSYTTTEWTSQNGVYGRKITSKSNGKSLFLPAAGYRDGTSLDDVGNGGYYWSRTLYTSYPKFAYGLSFFSDFVDWYSGSRGWCGQSIRPVRNN